MRASASVSASRARALPDAAKKGQTVTHEAEHDTEQVKRTWLLWPLNGLSYLAAAAALIGAIVAVSGELEGVTAVIAGVAGFLSLQLLVYIIELLEDVRTAARRIADTARHEVGSHRKTLEALARIELLQQSELIDRDEGRTGPRP